MVGERNIRARLADVTYVGVDEGTCVSFKGVPFAASPVGPLRWRPPQPHVQATGQVRADRFGDASLQFFFRDGDWTPKGSSEDCLHLNVWTPTTTPDALLPVIFWIHGGSFTAGATSAPTQNGAAFARDGVVLVSCGYRVGALGFTHFGDLFPELAGSGNLGLLDQMAALRWTREHIAAFGGDPDRITLAGCSAGAMSVGALLAVPEVAAGVRGAIMQSGALSHWLEAGRAQAVADTFCEAAGVMAGDLAALEALSEAQILTAWVAAGQKFGVRGADAPSYGIPYGPVVDGHLFSRPPIEAWRAGAAGNVALLIGSTAQEWRLFSGFNLPVGLVADDLPAELDALAARAGRRGRDLSAPYLADGPLSAPALTDRIETDRWYRMPAVRVAEAQLAHTADVWMYRFDWASPVLGAAHGLCQPFVFDQFAPPEVPDQTGPNPPRALADTMHAAWVAFAARADPGGGALGDWPRYDLTRRATMLLDVTSRVADDPDAATRLAWEGIV